MRRKLERERKRYDVFVAPRGPEIPKKVRAKRPPIEMPPKPPEEPPPVEPPVVDAEFLITQPTKDGGEVLLKETEFLGEFNFRDTILDQLERYFVYIKRMKKHDKDSYELYRQVGITLMPLTATGMNNIQFLGVRETWENSEEWRKDDCELPPWFLTNKPSFGCFAWGTNTPIEKYEDEETARRRAVKAQKGYRIWHPKFMYFTKYDKPPPTMQLPQNGGTVYKMTMVWDRHGPDQKHAVPEEYGVAIDADGNVQILKMMVVRNTKFPGKRSRLHGKRGIKRRTEWLTRAKWALPPIFVEDGDAEQRLKWIFSDVVKRWEASLMTQHTRVTVTKDNLAAVFSVSPRRMAYFFQDRDIVLSANGNRIPVFHAVKAHKRTTRDGREYNVPLHFRGMREFEWAGYHVQITLPLRDHPDVNAFDAGALDQFWCDDSEKYATMKELGKLMAETVRGVA